MVAGQAVASAVEDNGGMLLSEIAEMTGFSRSSVWSSVNKCNDFELGWKPVRSKRGIKWCRLVRLKCKQ